MTDAEKTLYAVFGIVLGLLIRWAIEVVTRWREKRSNARYLAVRVVHELERFAAGCLAVADDPGPQHYNYQHFTPVARPIFSPHDLKVEWKAIDCMLVYDILGLASDQSNAEHKIAVAAEDPSADQFYMLELACDQYITLGLQATNLAERVRTVAGLPNAKPDLEAALSTWSAKRRAVKRKAAARWREIDPGAKSNPPLDPAPT